MVTIVTSSIGDLKTVVDSLKLLLIDQYQDYILALEDAKTRLPHELRLSFLRELVGQVTPFALLKGSGDNLARSFRQKHNMKLLKHSAQSLDLNPHEGVWGILKPRVRKHQWNSLSELKRVILDE